MGGSCVVSSVTVLLSGSFGAALSFVGHHPAFLFDASLLSASAVAGQWFIYSQVKEFGALVFAATMNVRQVASILLSYVTYGHSITALQVLGLVAVFSALFFKSAQGMMATDSTLRRNRWWRRQRKGRQRLRRRSEELQPLGRSQFSV